MSADKWMSKSTNQSLFSADSGLYFIVLSNSLHVALQIPTGSCTRLTRSEHLDCEPPWSSEPHSTDPGPAGSPSFVPVPQMGQSGCHLHPEGWKMITFSYWQRCVCSKVFACVCASYSPVEVHGTSSACKMASSVPSDPNTCKQRRSAGHYVHLWIYCPIHVCTKHIWAPLVALPEGCGRPKTEARGEQCQGAEAQPDPRMGLCLWVMLRLTTLLLSDRRKQRQVTC